MRTLIRSILAGALLFGVLGSAPAERGRVQVDVLFTSDIHGHIDTGEATFLNPEFPPPLGGGASIAAYVKTVRAQAAAAGRRVLLFDQGDMFQGTPLGTNTKGTAIIEWMNRLHYDAATLGNHDFDLGRDNAERLAEMAKFPILVANLYDSTTGQRVAWARDHVMFDVHGIKIALLGYITESTVNMAFAKNIAGLEFRRIGDMLPADAKRMREELGADLVFALVHHGLPYRLDVEQAYQAMVKREAAGDLVHFGMDAMELARLSPEVDVIFGGHTHQGYDEPWEDPVTHTLVFEAYANGSSLGHVTFDIDRKTKQLVGYDTHFDRGALLTLLEDEVWPDEEEANIIGEQVTKAEAGLEKTIGRTTVLLASGPADNALMGFVMTDAYREELGADFAIQNTGGVRGTLPPGPITARDILQISPFNNQLVLCEMPGSMLRGILEDKLAGRGGGMFISGGQVRYDLGRPDGHRIVSFTIGGEPIDTTRIYKVALTDYLAEGNSGLMRLLSLPPERFLPSGFTDREILTRYIRRLGTLSPKNDGRWQRVRGS